MSPKFFYVYLIGGIVSLILVIYNIVTLPPVADHRTAALYFILPLLLLYMAYKVYHVKNDSELM